VKVGLVRPRQISVCTGGACASVLGGEVHNSYSPKEKKGGVDRHDIATGCEGGRV